MRFNTQFLRTSVIFFSAMLTANVWGASNCPPQGYSRSQLLELRKTGFKLDDQSRRNALALALTGCLADPDPEIRDGVVYEGLTAWMREAQLSNSTLQSLLETSLTKLAGEGDRKGFEKPFTALVLAEVARTDRVDPWMTKDQRLSVVSAAADYLSSVDDYRGFSETEGWRHGVAHGSDLVLQLVLNEAIDGASVRALMDAARTQISPAGEHFYIYGEPGRLARAMFYAYQSEVVDDAAWSAWLGKIALAAPLENWGESYSSQQGLAKRHNTLEFLMALHLNAVYAEAESLEVMVMGAIMKVMGG